MKKHIFLLAVLACVSVYPAAARADDFLFVRPNDPDRVFKQDEALVVVIPESLSQAELGSFFLELDGIDITQRVTLEGTHVVFYPASPYAAGTHALRLVRMGKNAKLVEIERWSFNVAGGVPPVVEPSSVSATVDSTYSYRAYDNYDDDKKEPDIHNLTTQMQFNAATQQGSWRLSMRGNAFQNTDDAANPAGDAVEVGEYLMRAENAGETLSSTFSLGNHDIGASNLLMDQFYRRGFSGKFDYKQGRATMTGFAMNPAAATGNNNWTGLSDGDRLASGVYTTLEPFAALGDRLQLEATAYTGEGSTNGSGTTPVPVAPMPEGNGYHFGTRTQLLKDRLSMRAQYASSDFDADGASPAPSERDNAYNVSFVLTPLSKQADAEGRFQQWEIEPGYYRAGSFFQSLLNPSLETDRETWSLKNHFIKGNLSLDGQVAWIKDNVDRLSDVPDNRSLQLWAQASYAPEKVMWGTPVFTLGGALSDDLRLRTPAGFAGDGLDRQLRSVNGGVVLSFEKATWSLNQTYSEMDDHATPNASYETSFSDVSVEFRAHERLTLHPGLQLEVTHSDTDGTNTSLHGSMGLQGTIVPDKFWNTTNYSMLLKNGDTTFGRTYNAETDFTWLLKPSETNSPGYAVSLLGLYDNDTDTNDLTDREDEDLRVLLRLKFSGAFSY